MIRVAGEPVGFVAVPGSKLDYIAIQAFNENTKVIQVNETGVAKDAAAIESVLTRNIYDGPHAAAGQLAAYVLEQVDALRTEAGQRGVDGRCEGARPAASHPDPGGTTGSGGARPRAPRTRGDRAFRDTPLVGWTARPATRRRRALTGLTRSSRTSRTRARVAPRRSRRAWCSARDRSRCCASPS